MKFRFCFVFIVNLEKENHVSGNLNLQTVDGAAQILDNVPASSPGLEVKCWYNSCSFSEHCLCAQCLGPTFTCEVVKWRMVFVLRGRFIDH